MHLNVFSVFEKVIRIGIEYYVPYVNGKNYSKPSFNKRRAEAVRKKIKYSKNGFLETHRFFQNTEINVIKLLMKPTSPWMRKGV